MMNGSTNGSTRHPPQNSTNDANSLDSDIALLTSLLSQSNGSDEREIEGPELQELLKRLETADGFARGVESRLDTMIGNLDQILGGLEAAGHGSEANHQSDKQTEHPEAKPANGQGYGNISASFLQNANSRDSS